MFIMQVRELIVPIIKKCACVIVVLSLPRSLVFLHHRRSTISVWQRLHLIIRPLSAYRGLHAIVVARPDLLASRRFWLATSRNA